jgi:hypothetical protein
VTPQSRQTAKRDCTLAHDPSGQDFLKHCHNNSQILKVIIVPQQEAAPGSLRQNFNLDPLKLILIRGK